jgi:hypothetical protein
MESVTRDDNIKTLLSKRELFGVPLLKEQIGETTRLTHLFGEHEWSRSEVETNNLTASFRKCSSDIAGASRNIQDPCSRLRMNSLNESSQAILVRNKRTRCVRLCLLRKFLDHESIVIH